MTAPLCKDCAHFLPSLYEHEDNSDYWVEVKLINAGCGLKTLPDVVYGTTEGIKQPAIRRNNAWHMRTDGACGLDGRFFEPKGEKSK